MLIPPQVKAQTLLIVGGNDTGIIELNEQVYVAFICTRNRVR